MFALLEALFRVSSWIRAYSTAGELLWAAAQRDGCDGFGSVQRSPGGELLALRDCRLPGCGDQLRIDRDPYGDVACSEVRVVAYRRP